MIYTCMILHGHLHLHTQHLYQPMITQMLTNEPMLESYIGVHLISTMVSIPVARTLPDWYDLGQ
jgi:hypothetical protein